MNFDRVAPFYSFLETVAFGRTLQRARTAFLLQVHNCEHALVVGEGNGRFLAELVRCNPEMHIDCIDASAAMLRLARDRTGSSVIANNERDLITVDEESARSITVSAARDDAVLLNDNDKSRVRFHHADVLDWFPDRGGYDLVVTHFFLDCFTSEQLLRVIEKISFASAPKARWLIADFTIPRRGLSRFTAHAVIAGLYVFFRLAAGISTTRLCEYTAMLQSHGFLRADAMSFLGGVVKSELWNAGP